MSPMPVIEELVVTTEQVGSPALKRHPADKSCECRDLPLDRRNIGDQPVKHHDGGDERVSARKVKKATPPASSERLWKPTSAGLLERLPRAEGKGARAIALPMPRRRAPHQTESALADDCYRGHNVGFHPLRIAQTQWCLRLTHAVQIACGPNVRNGSKRTFWLCPVGWESRL